MVPDWASEERVLGDPDAPVTIVEYASLTCPHCAEFHAETLPRIEEEYIASGKAKLVYRDFPLDRVALQASMMARCAPEDRYFGLLSVLFRSQEQWSRAADPAEALTKIGRLSGLEAETIENCLQDEGLRRSILQGRLEAERNFEVTSTPTFIIGGEKLVGAQPFENFKRVLDDELGGR